MEKDPLKQKTMKEKLFSVTKDDFIMQTYRGSGAGGQHRNKTSSCVRLIHKETGIRAECCEERDQFKNKKKAFLKLYNSPEFQLYLKKRGYETIIGKQQIEKMVDKMMRDDNILIEYFDGTKWVKE
jgi:protein subunit release factor B